MMFKQGTRSGRSAGFTLVELMITVGIMAILAATAVPSFSRMFANTRISTKTNELKAALQVARAEAQRRGNVAGVSMRATSNNENFNLGWRIFTDANLNGVEDSGETLLFRQGTATGNTTIRRVTRSGTAGAFTYADEGSQADRMVVTFNNAGQNNAAGPAFFRICDSVQTAVSGRIIQVSVAGIITLDTSNASCT